MSIEIGQLVVNARVVADAKTTTSATTSNPEYGAHGDSQEKMIERCVSEVLRVLEDKRER